MKSLPAVTQRAGTPRDRAHEGHVVTPSVDVPSADRRIAASGSTTSGSRSSEEEPQVWFQCDAITYINSYRKCRRRQAHYPTEEVADALLTADAQHSPRGMPSVGRSGTDDVAGRRGSCSHAGPSQTPASCLSAGMLSPGLVDVFGGGRFGLNVMN